MTKWRKTEISTDDPTEIMARKMIKKMSINIFKICRTLRIVNTSSSNPGIEKYPVLSIRA